MKIVFNLQAVGLGSNGGSRTLIKCAETLQGLGHEAFIWCSENNYKWGKIKVPVTKSRPSCDVIVATGYRSVPTTLSAKVKRKFYYIRGLETWQAKEPMLVRSFRSLNCIVNSEWLQNYMKKRKIKAHLVYPGVDFDLFGNDNEDRGKVLGGIFSTRHATKRHNDVINVGSRLGYKVLLLNRDIVNPKPADLRSFYNQIMVWMSPSELEGLHNCPLEAALCGSSLVTTDHARGGVSDYALRDRTALIYPARKLEKAAEQVKRLMENEGLRRDLDLEMQQLLKAKIRSRNENMKRMVEIFEGSHD